MSIVIDSALRSQPSYGMALAPDTSKLTNILGRLLGMSSAEITDATSMENTTAWDSLRHIEIIAALEEEFQISSLTIDEIVNMTSVRAIRCALNGRGVAL